MVRHFQWVPTYPQCIFSWRIKKDTNYFWLKKKMPYLEQWDNEASDQTADLELIWTTTWENIPSEMPTMKTGLRMIHAVWSVIVVCLKKLHSWLVKMHPAKILIRLGKCVGWSESLLWAHVQRNIFWCGSFVVPALDLHFDSCFWWSCSIRVIFSYANSKGPDQPAQVSLGFLGIFYNIQWFCWQIVKAEWMDVYSYPF